jgi:hypothetical protein
MGFSQEKPTYDPQGKVPYFSQEKVQSKLAKLSDQFEDIRSSRKR